MTVSIIYIFCLESADSQPLFAEVHGKKTVANQRCVALQKRGHKRVDGISETNIVHTSSGYHR